MGDVLALYYPAQTPIASGTFHGGFEVNLSGQTGRLEDIAAGYHYIYGRAEVTSVSDGKAHAAFSSMKSLLALCRFTFVDGDGNAIPVKKLDISYYDNTSSQPVGYPQSVTVMPSDDVEKVSAEPDPEVDEDFGYWDDPLTINLETETTEGVYVALFPNSLIDYMHFSVTNSSGTYTGTAKAKLNAGGYYPALLRIDN